MSRIRNLSDTAIVVEAAQKTATKRGVTSTSWNKRPTTNKLNDDTEVALSVSRGSSGCVERRLESYRPNAENMACQTKSKHPKRAKFCTLTRIDKNCASGISGEAVAAPMVAMPKAKIITTKSQSLAASMRTRRRSASIVATHL